MIFGGNDVFPVDPIEQLLHQILKRLDDPKHARAAAFWLQLCTLLAGKNLMKYLQEIPRLPGQ